MPNAVVTGAGSGVGRATAIRLAQAGWRIALVGRREEMLQETMQLAEGLGKQMLICAGDVGDAAAMDRLATEVLGEFGRVDAAVAAAGTNTKRRSLQTISQDEYREVMQTNVDGVYNTAQAFLPGMRKQKEGMIVVINSTAGLQANFGSGAIYATSKFAVAGMVQAINVEEGPNGIRACSIFPGEIDTPILDKRPVVPNEAQRDKMLQAIDVAECVLLALSMPRRALIEEIVIRPSQRGG